MNFQHLNLTRRLFNNVANFDQRLHIKLCNIFDKIYQFVFDKREDDFITTISQQTMFMHFLQQSIIIDCVDVVNEKFDVVHENNNRSKNFNKFAL